MPQETRNLVIGRGEVFFDRFLPGTSVGEGERYIGNTPVFRIQRDMVRLDRMTSYRGRKAPMPGAVISESNTINFTTDNVHIENIGMWLGAAPVSSVATDVDISETFPIRQGRFYQLGKSRFPAGLQSVALVRVYAGGSIVNSVGNYRVDLSLGRLEILPDAPALPNGTNITAVFQVRESDSQTLFSQPQELLGALRFVAFNEGVDGRPQNDFFFPSVRIAPRGQIDLKSDEWQQWTFEATAVTLRPGVEQMYMMRRGAASAYTSDEQAILNEFGDHEIFPFWDDQLHVVTNDEWPTALGI